MHKSSHSLEKPPQLALRKHNANRRAAFSLVEVSLAVAIIAFAFVSLIGLLPAGLQVFKKTTDATNEMRIFTDLTSMLQSTEYEAIDTPQSGTDLKTKLFYYDAEGSLLDSKNGTSSDDETARVYVAKFIFEKQNIPAATEINYDQPTIARKGIIVVGKYTKPVLEVIDKLQTSDDILIPANKSKIHWLPVLIAKTDGKQSK